MTPTSDRVRSRTAALRAVCLAVICLTLSAKVQSQDADVSGRVDVRNVTVAVLLYAMAEAVNFNLVAPIPKGAPLVSMSTEYSSIDDLLQKLAKLVGMRGVVLGHRILVLSPCLDDQARNTPPQAPSQFSLRLPNATLKEVLELEFPEFLVKGNPSDVAMLSRRVLLRLKNVSRDEAQQAVSAALGGAIAPDSLDKLIAGQTGVEGCPGAESAPLSIQQEQSKSLRLRKSNCPNRTPNGGACEPLEYFSLKQLFRRGFIEAENPVRRFAFVEAPDGILHVVKKGAYVGQDFGRVVEVSRNGIQLIELIQDSASVWTESKSELQYWIDPEPLKVELRSQSLPSSQARN